MTKLAVKKGLEILSGSQNIDALRRLIVMTIVGRNLRPASANEEKTNDDSLSVLLSRLPTKTLAEVASISKGKTGIKDALPGPFPLVVTAETRNSADHFDFEGPAVMIPMVSSTGHGDASLKRIHFQDGQYAVGSILAVVRPKDSSVLSARYLHAFLSAFKDELLVSRMVGTANVSLTVAKIGDVPVPLLPIQGQHEIAELMALCDRLEAEQADAVSAHVHLVEALLGTLTQSADAADFAANWQRLAEHFDTLFTTEASIEAIKQTVLQLAVMGRLVPQEAGAEPASELLKQIAQERRRLAPPTGKKSNPQPPTTYKEGPFGIPNSWVWTDVESISNVGTGTTPSRTNPAYFNPAQIHWVTSGETRDAFIGTTAEKISPLALEETNLTIYPVGTLIVAMYGQGKTRGQISELQIDATTNQACAAIVPILPNVATRKYIKLFFRKIYDEIREEAAGGAQPNLNVGKIKATLIPLPPLTEQKRIVAKVDELMALCDRLKSDLAIACQRQTTLANTLIESALEAA